jgi:O-antigen ligase
VQGSGTTPLTVPGGTPGCPWPTDALSAPATLSGTVGFSELGPLVSSVAALHVNGHLHVTTPDLSADMTFRAGWLLEVSAGSDRGRSALDAIWLAAAQAGTDLQFAYWQDDEEPAAGVLGLIAPNELPQYLDQISRQALTIGLLFQSREEVPWFFAPESDEYDSEPIHLDRHTLRLLRDVDGRRTVADLATIHGELPTLTGLFRLIDLGILAVSLVRPAVQAWVPATTELRQTVRPGRAPVMLQVVSWTLLSAGLALGCWLAPGAAAVLLGALCLGVPIIYLLWRRPEFGLLGLMALTAGLLRASDLYVPLPLGGLYPADVALLGLFGLFGLRALLHEGVRIKWWPVSGPLLVFLALCLLSVGYAVRIRGIGLHEALNELRPLAFYGVAVLTTLALTRGKQLTTLLVGLFVLADVIVAALFLQQFAGAGGRLLPGMHDWQVNQLGATGAPDVGAESVQDFGLVRIVPPAVLLLFFMSVLAFVRMLTSRGLVRVAYIAEFALLNGGLLLTYTRAQWIASLISIGVSVPLLPPAARAQVIRSIPMLLLVVLVGVTAGQAGVEPPEAVGPFLEAIVSRATSTLAPEKTLSSSSLQWRAFETGAALRSLAESPWGVGLGNIYRPVTTLAGEAVGYQGSEPLNRFVHNSYLYIAVKTGILGLAAFLWFCLAFVANGWRALRRMVEGPDRWLTIAAVASFVGTMQWSFTEANFMQTGSTVVVGLVVGLVACRVRAATQRDLVESRMAW